MGVNERYKLFVVLVRIFGTELQIIEIRRNLEHIDVLMWVPPQIGRDRLPPPVV